MKRPIVSRRIFATLVALLVAGCASSIAPASRPPPAVGPGNVELVTVPAPSLQNNVFAR